MKKSPDTVLAACAVTAAALIGEAVLVLRGAPRAAFCILLLFLLSLLLTLSFTLRRSLKATLYSYANIALIGGILFSAVLTAVLGVRFIRCLRADDFSLPSLYRALVRFPRQFSYYAVFVLVVVCVLLGVSNLALIRHEGFRARNALSVLVAAVYLGGTYLAYLCADLFDRYLASSEELRASPLPVILNTAVSLFLLLMLCYFECILVGSAIMGFLAARQKPAHDKDFIIILGCSIDRRGGLLPLLKGRVNRAIRFAWEQEIDTGKPVHYVPSGGQGANEVMSEGSAMELYLMTRGAESYEIFPEKRSATTWENMCFSKAVIDAITPGAKVAFATTNYHMLRSGILARRAGLDAEGIAGDTKWYFWPNGFVREFFAILRLNVRAHVCTAAAAALLCTAIGIIGFYADFM